jgi:hypothetical protein
MLVQRLDQWLHPSFILPPADQGHSGEIARLVRPLFIASPGAPNLSCRSSLVNWAKFKNQSCRDGKIQAAHPLSFLKGADYNSSIH